ncbi:hypothetical protein ABT104_32200 [Streptomyces mobaraensis]|uniref:vWA domain-containing protein n=1 Tax=Streptomyces mobaraensis TaxID=35621 RepID=UPI00331FBF25
MSAELPLILDEEPLDLRGLRAARPAGPVFALVRQNPDGIWQLETDNPLNRTFAWAPARRRYVRVDLGDHRRTGRLLETPLPCSDQAHRFEATVEVGFRVHDPVEIVRRNVRDALPVVYGYLKSHLRHHARRFAIDQAQQADEHINRILAGQTVLPEGITIFHCTVQLEPDEAARDHIRALTRGTRDSLLEQRAHLREVGIARHEAVVKDIEQEARLAREERERRVLASVPGTLRGMIGQHLAVHPEDTARAVELMAHAEQASSGRAETQEQRHTELLRFLVEKDIIRQVDLARLREEILQRVDGAGGRAPLDAGAGPRPDPAGLPAGAPVVWGGSAGSAPPSGPRAPARGVVPVYAVLDTSDAVTAGLTELNDGIRSLHTLLGNSPDAAGAVRLAVLGFAERAEAHLPSTEVRWGTDVPVLTAAGTAHYGPALEALERVIPEDVERLKGTVRTVHRPTVFFLTADTPADGSAWTGPHRRLLEHRYAPTVVACGVGRADARTVARLTTGPGLALTARPGTDTPTAVAQFCVLLQNAVLHLGRSAVAGRPELRLDRPHGLVPVVGDE